MKAKENYCIAISHDGRMVFGSETAVRNAARTVYEHIEKKKSVEETLSSLQIQKLIVI